MPDSEDQGMEVVMVTMIQKEIKKTPTKNLD